MITRRRPYRVPPDPIYEAVGALVTAARGARTIESVAQAMGLSRQVVSAYERGRSAISVARLVQLAAVLGVEPVELIPRHDAAAIPYQLAATPDDLKALRRLAGQNPGAPRDAL